VSKADSGVLHWYDSKIDNVIMEGLNSLVGAAKAKARGYRTFGDLKAILYVLTRKLDCSKIGLPTRSEKEPKRREKRRCYSSHLSFQECD
jgi:transposase